MKKLFRRTATFAILALAALRGFAAQNPPKQPLPVLGQKLFSFGTKGTGPGQMTDLDFVAVDPQGFLYVADYELHRVQRFSRDGKLDSLFYFDPEERVRSLAFDRGGFLWIVLGGRLLRYDPSSWTLLGEVELPGREYFVAAASRPAGGVVALAAGESDDVLFIRSDGTVDRTFKEPLKGRARFDSGSPELAVDSRDNLYISDYDVNSIFRLDPQGKFLNRFSSEGEGPGQVHTHVDTMAIDSVGHLWVGDWGGTNVFTSDGRFIRRFDDVDGDSYAISLQDELYAADNTSVTRYAAGDRPLPGGGAIEEPAPSTPQRPQRPADHEPAGLVAVDSQGALYVADANGGRILRFNAQAQLEGPLDLRPPGRPWTGLAVDRGGILYLAADNRLFRYDRTGKPLGEVHHPDGDGFYHVAPRPDAGVIASWRNAERDDLVVIGKDGAIETIHRNAVSGAAGEPAGGVLVAMDGRRNLYAAASRLHALFAFDPQGVYVNRFGSAGEEPGQLSGALTGLAVDGQGRIFVSDEKRINAFSTKDGTFLERRDGGGSGLAISDNDEVFAINGPKVTRFPAGPPVEED